MRVHSVHDLPHAAGRQSPADSDPRRREEVRGGGALRKDWGASHRRAAARALLASAVVLAAGLRLAHAGEPVAARLVSEHVALVPGTVAHLGILFDIDPGWHLFWNGCNETGYPIAAHPALPEGFRARALEWPAPKRLVSPGDILDHVYDGEVMLILPIDVPADAAAGSEVTLACDLEWVSCREACEIGGAEVSIRLPVVSSGWARPVAEHARLFEATRARIPRASTGAEPWLRYRWSNHTLVVDADGAEWMALYPQEGCESLVDLIRDGTSSVGQLAIRFRPIDGKRAPARGVLEVKRSGERSSRFVALDVPPPGENAARSEGR